MPPLVLPGWDTLPGTALGPIRLEAFLPFPVPALDHAERQAHHGFAMLVAAWLLGCWHWWTRHPAPWSPGTGAAWDRLLAAPVATAADWQALMATAWRAGAAQAHAKPPHGMPPEWQAAAAAQWAAWERSLRDTLRVDGWQAALGRLPPDLVARQWADRWRQWGGRWRRLVSTALNETYHAGLFAAVRQPAWGYVAPIGDAHVCRECHRLLEGRWFRLLAQPPADPTPDAWQRALWPGKRSPRPDGVRVPALPQHPHCRHVITHIRHQPPPEGR